MTVLFATTTIDAPKHIQVFPMSDTAQTVTVRILDKDYQVACPDDEVNALTASARFLDGQMQEIRNSGKVLGIDRIAVMAALNIANDFLKNQNVAGTVQKNAQNKISVLNQEIEQVLAEQRQLKL